MPRSSAALLLTLSLAAQAMPAWALAEKGEASTLALPIRVNLAPLLQQLEKKIPLSPPNLETWAPVRGKPKVFFRYNLIREPLDVKVNGDQVAVRVLTNYGADVGLRALGDYPKVVGSCGRAPEPPRQALFELKTTFGVRPDWGIELRQTTYEVKPLNPCQITFIDYDITDIVTSVMKGKIASAADYLGQLVSKNALARQKAQQAWDLLSQPIQLKPDLYLMIQPQRFRLAPLKTEGQILTLTPELEARPRVVLGARPQAAHAPLPRLRANAKTRPGFRLRVAADLSYAQASRQMAAAVVGKVFAADKKKVEITSARVWGDQGLALLEVGLKGRIKGKVTLSAKPVLDPDTNDLRLEALDFTLESRNWLARVGDWVYHSDLREVLADKAHFLLDQRLQGLRETVQAGLNRQLSPNLQLSGSLRTFQVASVTTGKDGFRTEATLEGEVQLDMK